MLTVSHQGQTIEIKPDSLVIIENASVDQYEKLANEDLKLDYDGARLYIHSPASKRHENIVFAILNVFKTYFADHPKLGEALGSHFSIKLPRGERTEPDVVIIPPDTVSGEESMYSGIPLLIIEVLSPSTRLHDLTNKKNWYMTNKVPEFWFIDPESKEILKFAQKPTSDYESHTLKKGIIESHQFAGLKVPIQILF